MNHDLSRIGKNIRSTYFDYFKWLGNNMNKELKKIHNYDRKEHQIY